MTDMRPLDFNLTTKTLSVIGSTNSALELEEFIKKLEALIPLLPYCDDHTPESETRA